MDKIIRQCVLPIRDALAGCRLVSSKHQPVGDSLEPYLVIIEAVLDAFFYLTPTPVGGLSRQVSVLLLISEDEAQELVEYLQRQQ